jgi:hypothetical protein
MKKIRDPKTGETMIVSRQEARQAKSHGFEIVGEKRAYQIVFNNGTPKQRIVSVKACGIQNAIAKAKKVHAAT